jgi:hypothetical protein
LDEILSSQRSPNNKTGLGYTQGLTGSVKRPISYADALKSPLRRKDNKESMMPLETVPNKHKSATPTKEKDDKKNTITRRNPSNRYQYIFLGYCYSCNNFGHRAIYCKSYRGHNPKNVQRSQKFNTEKRNYNSFSPLQDYNMECLKYNKYGHEASECRLSKYVKEINIPNNKKVWKKKQVEKTECKVALHAKNK